MKRAKHETFADFAIELARVSAQVIKPYFGTNVATENKSDKTPVTIADKTAERVMRELIQERFPEHGIVGEEFGKHNGEAEYQWYLDPIDGTKSFIAGGFDFGTMIALVRGGQPILGLINQPILEQLVIGDGRESFLNGERISVSARRDLKEARLLTTDLMCVGTYQNEERFMKLARSVSMCRTWGNCFGYTLVAQGLDDIMIDPIMNAWDIMALVPIIRGAGGEITDYHGGDPVKGNSIVATNAALHAEVIEILNRQ